MTTLFRVYIIVRSTTADQTHLITLYVYYTYMTEHGRPGPAGK
jgi:hypothetical protein